MVTFIFHKTIAANFEFTSQKRQGTAIYKKTNFLRMKWAE